MAECIDVTVHAEEWFIDELKESTQKALEWNGCIPMVRFVISWMRFARDLGFVLIDTPNKKKPWCGSLGELEKKMLLHFTDQFWKDHLLAMDRLRHGVSLRGRTTEPTVGVQA